MTTAKIAITLPPEQLQRIKLAVRKGRAESVSAYIVRALAQQDREESLADVLKDMIAEHGEPNRKEKAWASRVLARLSKG